MNGKQAGEQLGMGRAAVYRKLAQYGIDVQEFRS